MRIYRLSLNTLLATLLGAAALTLSGAEAPPATQSQTQPAATKPPAPAPARKVDLFADGTSDRFWIASVEPFNDPTYTEPNKPEVRTVIRAQAIPGGDWRDLGAIYSRAVGLAHLQGEAAIFLENGAWKRLGAALSSGPNVPGTGPLLACASGKRMLYAIRAYEGGRVAINDEDDADPSTRPTPASVRPPSPPALAPAAPTPVPVTTPIPATTRATKPATGPTTTRPATAPATNSITATTTPASPSATPVLFKYDRSRWHPVADLPAIAARLPAPAIALGVLADRPVLAIQTEHTAVRTLAWADDHWEDWGAIRLPPGATFSLVSTPGSIVLWVVDQDGAMSLHQRTDSEPWSPAKPLAAPAAAPADAQRAFTPAGEEFRLVLLKDGKLLEQRYSFAGQPNGAPAQLPAATPAVTGSNAWIFQTIVLAGMVIVILLTLYKRRSETPPTEEE